jgi:hypothetical protein
MARRLLTAAENGDAPRGGNAFAANRDGGEAVAILGSEPDGSQKLDACSG